MSSRTQFVFELFNKSDPTWKLIVMSTAIKLAIGFIYNLNFKQIIFNLNLISPVSETEEKLIHI